MSGEIQIVTNDLLTSKPSQPTFTNTGDNGIQIVNQGTVNVFHCSNSNPVYDANCKICTEYYNLFVIENELFNDGCFLIGKDCALTISEGVETEISQRYARLTPDAIAQIKTFPSLFAGENHQNKHTDATHKAFIGVVTDIKLQGNDIRIYFEKRCSVPQQRLNELTQLLGIKESSMFNELNRTHWAIKKVNLLEKLRAAGLNVMCFT